MPASLTSRRHVDEAHTGSDDGATEERCDALLRETNGWVRPDLRRAWWSMVTAGGTVSRNYLPEMSWAGASQPHHGEMKNTSLQYPWKGAQHCPALITRDRDGC